MNHKKSFLFLAILFIVFSSIILISAQSAIEDAIAKNKIIPQVIKFIALGFITVLIFSLLQMANFPENFLFRLLISIAIGILATFFISTSQLMTIVYGYSITATAFSVIIPIIILAIFTAAMAFANVIVGLYVQRVLWIIFSAYVFLKSVVLWFLITTVGKRPGEIDALIGKQIDVWGIVNITIDKVTATVAKTGDLSTAITLMVVSIICFIVMVFMNDKTVILLAKLRAEADSDAKILKMHEAAAYDKLKAAELDKSG